MALLQVSMVGWWCKGWKASWSVTCEAVCMPKQQTLASIT